MSGRYQELTGPRGVCVCAPFSLVPTVVLKRPGGGAHRRPLKGSRRQAAISGRSPCGRRGGWAFCSHVDPRPSPSTAHLGVRASLALPRVFTFTR